MNKNEVAQRLIRLAKDMISSDSYEDELIDELESASDSIDKNEWQLVVRYLNGAADEVEMNLLDFVNYDIDSRHSRKLRQMARSINDARMLSNQNVKATNRFINSLLARF